MLQTIVVYFMARSPFVGSQDADERETIPWSVPQRLVGDAGGFTERAAGDRVQRLEEADLAPVDLYVVFDQNESMATPSGAGSRLDGVRAAIADFMRDE
jgi:hypothetical protein